MLIQRIIPCGGPGTRLWSEGQGVKETGTVVAVTVNKSPAVAASDVLVKIDKRYFRPYRNRNPVGRPTKAKEKIGWVTEIKLGQVIKEMYARGLDQVRRHALLKQHGDDMTVGVEQVCMSKTQRIFITGHCGVVGSAAVSNMHDKGHKASS